MPKDTGCRPPSRDCCCSTRAAARPRRRCAKRNTASGRRSPGPSWPRMVRAPGLRAAPRRACSAASTWWWSARTGRACTRRCWPRSRWARSRCRCTRTRRPAEFVFPINNAEVAFRASSKTRSRSTSCSSCARSARSSRASGTTTRAACATTTSRAWHRWTRLVEAGRAYDAAHAGFFDAEVAKASPHDVAAMFFTSGTTGNPKGVVHTHFTLLDRAARRRARSTS